MKPAVNINFNDVFTNTKFMDELSVVVYGAELALKYVNAPEAQVKEITANIVRSAFVPFSLNYDNMTAAARANAANGKQEAGAGPADVNAQPYAGQGAAYGADAADYHYFTDAPAQAEAQVYGNAGSDPMGTPDNGGYDTGLNNHFEQTVVYENFSDPMKRTDFDPESPGGYEDHPNVLSSTWEPENRKDENMTFGKIHWTTYSSAANLGDLPSDAPYNPSGTDSENNIS